MPINGAQNEAIPDGLKRLQENLAWKRSRGYFTPADHESYASYDVKVLEALAAGGDLLASSVLVHGYIEGRFTEDASGQLPDKTHELWREGIVIGSTRAIAGAALRAEGAALNHEDPHSPESKQDFMEALALYELGYLRGDRDVLRSGLALARQFDLSFSPEEKMEIHRRAKRLYRELEAERVLRGFGPFDNSRPPAVTNWELFPRPNDWGSNYYDDVVAEYKALQSP
ncbi:hypothetical protein [Microbulbifer guangxiensis]|uniref:hypothetical protein n=1 Tax=Microbulbifer guangxiensis TaxID=2904249 RepID=UPI001F37FA3C|nr:hypothetical protein [Microbulbifer guangxiensis]